MKNIFLTGRPGCGKTTVIKKTIALLGKVRLKGFYTAEMRSGGIRVSFQITTFDGKQGLLAHENLQINKKVGKYGVCLKDIDAVIVPSIRPDRQTSLIIMDEIGKMECYSEEFKKAAVQAVECDAVVLGTIAIGGTPFIDTFRRRSDIKLIEVTRNNRERLPQELAEIILKKLKKP
ncbi:MAG: nucleoside-triphosphatase [Candidatus Aminicenantes bacterium]|nr:nucleoside-triphosphatase [Candidatus Aminicenantes bacterium]